jgi:hypothetical protein
VTLVCAFEVLDKHDTLLVLVVDSTFRQVNKPRSGHTGQSRGQIVSFHPIVTASSLNDHVVDLGEFIGVAGAVILVDRLRLELVVSHNLHQLRCQSTEHAPP